MNRSDSERLRRIEALLERLDSAVVVKDPGSARSADAFEGLRRTIIQNAKSHRVHVAHLIALDESIWSGATIELIRFRVAEYLRELGVERLEDSSVPEAFDIVGDGQGEFEVLEPAIIERGEDGNFSIILEFFSLQMLCISDLEIRLSFLYEISLPVQHLIDVFREGTTLLQRLIYLQQLVNQNSSVKI